MDPFVGAQIAVAEGVRNLACVGATPAALTDCLNFGSPEKPEVFYTFERAIDGVSEAARYFETPVISGNVSFYNESFGTAIYPTPTLGMVGVMDDFKTYATPAFKKSGDTIFLIGETADELGGSQYLSVLFDEKRGTCPVCDLELERDTSALVRKAVVDNLLASAHDISEGGIAVALAECCIAGNTGAYIVLDDDLSAASSLFSETQARFVLSVDNTHAAELIARLIEAKLPYSVVGEVREAEEGIEIEGKIKVSLAEASKAYKGGLEQALEY